MVRPGGRSARVQAAVHAAVRELTAEMGRDALTVPLIAQRAGVTPSTVYRRWGDLRELLSDVAVERLRPDTAPRDHGCLAADLTAWAEQFLDEMASPTGRTYIRDALLGDPDGGNAAGAPRTRPNTWAWSSPARASAGRGPVRPMSKRCSTASSPR